MVSHQVGYDSSMHLKVQRKRKTAFSKWDWSTCASHWTYPNL